MYKPSPRESSDDPASGLGWQTFEALRGGAADIRPPDGTQGHRRAAPTVSTVAGTGARGIVPEAFAGMCPLRIDSSAGTARLSRLFAARRVVL